MRLRLGVLGREERYGGEEGITGGEGDDSVDEDSLRRDFIVAMLILEREDEGDGLEGMFKRVILTRASGTGEKKEGIYEDEIKEI